MSSADLEPILKVKYRGGFADRNGIKSENNNIQFQDLDDRTRISLVNVTNLFFTEFSKKMRFAFDYQDKVQTFIKNILYQVYMQEVDYNITYDIVECMNVINDTIKKDNFSCVFSLLEYLGYCFSELLYVGFDPYNLYNIVFKKEYVGYRFVNKQIVQITNDTEIAEIEGAVNTPYHKVDEHVSKAINYLSDRDNPDYENSIKESISGVEAMCSIILGEKGNLGQTLNKLEATGIKIHPSMKEAFKKLYGYTSDATGIRHAGDIGGESSTFEEAKFMLVTCSAFINYLIGVTSK